MRPVRFVALSEDGQALVLADEVGRLLALPIDDRVTARAARRDRCARGSPCAGRAPTPAPSLSPRDIQARIRAGESAEDVARIAGVPVDRVLRYAGPVLQERAMLAQHARRTRLKTVGAPARRSPRWSTAGSASTASTPRRSPGTRTGATTAPGGSSPPGRPARPPRRRSGISTRPARSVTPHDDMAQYLCAERPTPMLGQEPRDRSAAGTPCPVRRVREPGGAGTACRPRRPSSARPAGIRSGPAATRCSPRSTGRSARPPARPRPGRPAGRRRPGSGRSRAAPPRCSAVARARPSTTTRTRQGGPGRAVAGGAAAPPAAGHGGADEAATRRQAAQAAAELGRRALRQRAGGAGDAPDPGRVGGPPRPVRSGRPAAAHRRSRLRARRRTRCPPGRPW